MSRVRFEPSSFRDRDSRVFRLGEHIYRALSPEGLADWQALRRSRFFQELGREGKIVATEESDLPAGELEEGGGRWAAVLRHETLPFVSYPYEWPFGMLQDAALLQLELVEAALAEEMILKDSSAYNVQWRGARPVFIDLGSFEPWRAGEPWVGYGQFCELFLYPLFLTAYKDLDFHPWLRGSLDGISPQACARIMSLSDLLRPGVLTHVWLQAKLRQRAESVEGSLRRELRAAGFNKELILRNVRRLRRLVAGLRWERKSSEWSGYTSTCSYAEGDLESKRQFVRRAAAGGSWNLVWDLGCNTGDFSRIAAEHADYVVALDADHLAVESFYRQLKAEGNRKILPLVNDLADASPGMGWRGRERTALVERPRPELALCLALLHHLVISSNLPLAEVLEWLAQLASHLVIEFVAKEDPMSQRLLRNKEDLFADYDLGSFESYLKRHFHIRDRATLESGTRFLYFASAREDGP